MLEIIKAMTGIIAIMTVFTTAIYFSFSIGLYEMLNINKSTNKEVLKNITIISMIFSMVIIFIANTIFSNETVFITKTLVERSVKLVERKRDFNIFIIHFFISCVIFTVFMLLIEKKRDRQVLGCSTYKKSKRLSRFFEWISLVLMCISAALICYQMKDLNLFYLYDYIKSSEQISIAITRATQLFEFFVICIINALAAGSIYSYGRLFILPKYIIGCDRFESGKVIAYIIAETDKEIMIKCEDSYPIILKKDLIEVYIPVDDDCTIDHLGQLRFDDKSKIYEGYMISGTKPDSKNNIKIVKDDTMVSSVK